MTSSANPTPEADKAGKGFRDNFSLETKRVLAWRVGLLCSNPSCRRPTFGPHTDMSQAINLGVAAHIAAASEHGPRPNNSLSPAQRKHIANAIWLCWNCSVLVDRDEVHHTVELLNTWKADAEQRARQALDVGPVSPAAAPGVEVEMLGGAIRFGLDELGTLYEEKNERNGRFLVDVNFRLQSSVGAVRLKKLKVNCYSDRGIPAWSISSSVSVVRGGGERERLAFIEGDFLCDPLPFDQPGSSPTVVAKSVFRPYLRSQYAYQWDYGFVEISGSVSLPGPGQATTSFSAYFKYDGARGLEASPAPEVYRLSDREVARRRRQGLLSSQEAESLLQVDPIRRYLIFTEQIAVEPDESPVARLISDLKLRMEDDYIPIGENGETGRAVRCTLAPGHNLVELPSTPRDPQSVSLTLFGNSDAEPLSVSERFVAWMCPLSHPIEGVFRYME